MNEKRKESHKATDKAADKAHEAVDVAAEKAGQAEDYLRGAAERAGEQSQDLLATVTDYVQKNPITAIALAFAAGTLYSSITRR